MNSMPRPFDPYNISKQDMSILAEILSNYVDEFETVMIFPDDMPEKDRATMSESLKRVHKLINKLRKGDKDVFKDPDKVDDAAREALEAF